MINDGGESKCHECYGENEQAATSSILFEFLGCRVSVLWVNKRTAASWRRRRVKVGLVEIT